MSARDELWPRRRLLRLAGLACAAAVGPARAGIDMGARHLRVVRQPVDRLPAIPMVDMFGQHERLDRALDTGDVPMLLGFIFTTCSSSCSVLTAIMSEVQKKAMAARRDLRLASITIDPDNDTPSALRAYAGRFSVGPGWRFYTGRFDDLLEVQRRFDVYRGSKGSHPPVLLLRTSLKSGWMRIEGFPTPEDIVDLMVSGPTA